jgi:nucleotide-binding universal stress UspA family protein
MSVKDILVRIDHTPANSARLNLAVELALQHEAHLTGLCIIDLVMAPEGTVTGFNPVDMVSIVQLQERLRESAIKAAATLENEFRERLRLEGVEGEWRLVEGSAPAIIGQHARYADLTVLGQENPDDPARFGWPRSKARCWVRGGRS